MRFSPVVRGLLWFVMAVLSLFLAGLTLRYYSFRPDINFLHMKQWIVSDPVWRTAFYIHITGGVIALTIGPLQLLKVLRRKYKRIHRNLGKIYLLAILCIGAPSGLYMSLFAEGGAWATAGFSIMAMLWFYTTWMAYSSARARNFGEHERWMRRSYALTFSAVTLRLWVPISSMYFGMDHRSVIVLSAWVSWLANIAACELFILWQRVAKRRKPVLSRKPSIKVSSIRLSSELSTAKPL